MSVTDNKELVRRFFDERWNKQNYDVIDELAPGEDAEDHKAWVRSVLAAFSEYALTVNDMIAEGDQVALHWTAIGILASDYEGIGTPGDHIEFYGLAMVQVANGKIVADMAYTEGFGSVLLGQHLEAR